MFHPKLSRAEYEMMLKRPPVQKEVQEYFDIMEKRMALWDVRWGVWGVTCFSSQ